MNEELTIITHLDKEKERDFARLKRRRWGGWTFLVKGEWDQTPYNGGVVSFEGAGPVVCRRRHLYALKTLGIPSRIVAVAETSEPMRLELIAGAMMRALRKAGGDYVEGVIRWGYAIDWKLLNKSM